MSFHIGQQVVCVSDRFSPDPYWRSTVRAFPKLNAIYTIRQIVRGYGGQRGLIGFHLYEIVNPLARFIDDDKAVLSEPAFDSRHFRPVKPTSIKLFERLLAPVGSSSDGRKERVAKPLVPA